MRDAAATEPGVQDLVRQDHERRRLTQEALVGLLAERRPLRDGMQLDRAVDIFFALVNSYTYELLVGYRGWTPPSGRIGWSICSNANYSAEPDRPASTASNSPAKRVQAVIRW